MDDRISREVFVWQTFRERLIAQHELEESDPVLIDTLDGMTTLNERLAAVALDALTDEASAEGINDLIASLQARKARLERRAKHTRSVIAWAMQETGQAKIPSAGVTLSVREGKPKLIIDEDRLPMDFKKSKVTYTPDKEIIQDAIDRGEVPEGVQISNAEPVLTIRSK